MAWRVYYPLITRRTWADFDSKSKAEAYADKKRDQATNGHYGMPNGWRQVEVVEITGESRVG